MTELTEPRDTRDAVSEGELAATSSVMDESASASQVKRRLRVVRWVGASDLVLLIALVIASRLGNRELVSLLGPIHGVNYLFLVMLVSLGAVDKLWRWWFPALTFFTGGPLGSFLGEVFIERQLKTRASE